MGRPKGVGSYREPTQKLDPIVHALRKRRYELGLSADNVAERLSIALATMQSWESGKHIPALVWVHRWAKTLGYEVCLTSTTSQDKSSSA